MRRIRNFLLFSRLHTVIGTIVSITALYSIARCGSVTGGWPIYDLIMTLMACLGANIYIVGLNQLTDIEIDKLNKPYLPLASGAYSVALARKIILVSLLLALSIGIYYSGFLLMTILISLILGTIYSLPPFRLKRYYFWAAFCIVAIRGLVVNFGLFLHFNWLLSHSLHIPPVIWLLASAIFVFSLVIALFKDIPDIEGDRLYRISTLSIRLGARQVFMSGNGILLLLFATIMIVVAVYPQFWNATFLLTAHAIFAICLVLVASRIQPADKKSMRPYYQFIWLLFFMEYLAIALSQCFFS